MNRTMQRTFPDICFGLCLCLCLGLAEPCFAEPSSARAGDPLAAAWSGFWNAENDKDVARAAEAFRRAGATIDDVVSGLEAGRPYSSEVRKGQVDQTRRGTDGTPHPYRLLVPPTYDPGRSYEVRVYLHGGVGRPAWGSGGRWWRDSQRLEHKDQIAVFPAAWSGSQWWEASQAENLDAILHRLKRTYNVDDNRIHLFGISDGGTGVWFQAFRNPTPWATFLPFIGHPAVLSNRRMGTDGDMFVRNLVNRPFFVVTGDHDRLYPTSSVVPFLLLFQEAGAKLYHRPQADGGHDVRFWESEAPYIEAFLQAHPRDPLPDRLWWETERTDRYHRLHWLVVDELGEVEGESRLEAWNSLSSETESTAEAFPRRGASGRLEAQREGNTFHIRSEGVRSFTLLLAPKEIDFARPVRVEVNNHTLFSGKVEASLEPLLQWAFRDQDRSMLFTAELEIEIAGPGSGKNSQSSR